MKQLSKDQFELAVKFMKSKARGLERALFEYEFESGSVERVYKELAQFQNEDGGFGSGIEPDLRCECSSALGTTVALQHIARLGHQNTEMIHRAIQYLLQTYNETLNGWEIIPQVAEDAPRAMWWNYGVFTDHWGNPSAEIVGYLHDYKSFVPQPFLDRLTQYSIDYLMNQCDLKEMHEMLCYLRLAERLPQAQYMLIADKLHSFVDHCVVKNPEDRTGYGADPLLIIDSPQSRYYDQYADVIPSDLDQLIDSQSDEGSWNPNWTWGRYEDVWEIAKQEWQGVITLNHLRTLKNFGRIASYGI